MASNASSKASQSTQLTFSEGTQAFSLSHKLDHSILIVQLLKGCEDFSIWEYLVDNALCQFDLANLICYKIPHPHITCSEYAIWRCLSKQIKAWLAICIDQTIIHKLMTTGVQHEYTDEFFDAIQTITLGSGHCMKHLVYHKTYTIT